VTVLRKQIYERIQNNLQLEQANQKLVDQTETIAQTARMSALGEMSAGISHEINNPLMIISGNNELIEKAVQKDPIDLNVLQKRIQKSKVAIDRISYIIKGLLTFSRQNHDVTREDTPLETIINETFIFCFELLKSHDIELQIDPVPKILLSCRPLQISEVLFNLIKNADDHLQGLPNKEDRWVKILFQEDYRDILIKVINGGPLIPKEYHDKLFQPFFTTKPIGSRVGLGLPVSKGIIEDNGGELIFDRNAGFTTFIIKLPKSINV
jgi:C4-dicarboxylate-specific signal transduction histidine kinase